MERTVVAKVAERALAPACRSDVAHAIAHTHARSHRACAPPLLRSAYGGCCTRGNRDARFHRGPRAHRQGADRSSHGVQLRWDGCPDPDPDADADPRAHAGSDAGSGPDAGPHAHADGDAGSGPDAGPHAHADGDAGSGPDAGPHAHADGDADADPDAGDPTMARLRTWRSALLGGWETYLSLW
jgi:hypothetical protein